MTEFGEVIHSVLMSALCLSDCTLGLEWRNLTRNALQMNELQRAPGGVESAMKGLEREMIGVERVMSRADLKMRGDERTMVRVEREMSRSDRPMSRAE